MPDGQNGVSEKASAHPAQTGWYALSRKKCVFNNAYMPIKAKILVIVWLMA